MKTIQVAISIIFLTLSGCAHTEYQHGYAGYGGGYTAQRYYEYDGYGRSYYSPGTSFIYERSYVQPQFSHPHHEHEHFQDSHRYRGDWRAPTQPSTHQPRHFDGGHGDWSRRRDRDMDHMDRKFEPSQRHVEHAPNWAVPQQHREPSRDQHQHRKPEQQQDFGGNRRHGDGDRHRRGDGHDR